MSGWKFGGTNSTITPTVGAPNISLESAASEFAAVMEFSWGGEVTTSTVMNTSFSRAAEGVGAPATAITAQLFAENQAAVSLVVSGGDHATTVPAKSTGDLWATSWNAHGGVIRWLAAPGEEVIMLGVATVVLENSVGTATSSYGLVWLEY